MDGYNNIETFVMVDSFDRDQTLFPDSAVFAFPLETPAERCNRVDLVQAAVPNILYNVTVDNNQIFLKHHEYGLDFLLDVRIPPGHYDVFTFVDELARLLNESLDEHYTANDISVDLVFRLVSTGEYVVAAKIRDDGSIEIHDEDGNFVRTYAANEIVRITNMGRYRVLFLEKKGRMVIRFDLKNSAAHFVLIMAPPSSEEERQFYIDNRITPSKLRKIPYNIMGFKPDRNYSNLYTKFVGYDPANIGLTELDIDTKDQESLDMIMSTKYMQIFYEPYIYLHILEFVMDPDSVPSSWENDGERFKTIHSSDPEHPDYGKIRFKPLAKIMINTHPGQVVYYTEADYPNSKGLRDFIPAGSMKAFDKLTIVWTKKDGTILNFNKIDLTFIVRVSESSMPLDDATNSS